MMRSLYSGVAGLKTHQTKMDVIGNNIANVNTMGFKSSSVLFRDVLYQTTSVATAATPTTGGTNSSQIGLGAKVSSISTKITENGAAQSTNNPYDLMINGDSFFVVSRGGSNYFTKVGSFQVDGSGCLVTSNGYQVMGWQVDPDNPTQVKKNVVSALYPESQANKVSSPEQTTEAHLTGNIDFTDPDLVSTDGSILSLSLYDAMGYSYTCRFVMRKDLSEKDNSLYSLTLESIKDANNREILFDDDPKTPNVEEGGYIAKIGAGVANKGNDDSEEDRTIRVKMNPDTGAFEFVGKEGLDYEIDAATGEFKWLDEKKDKGCALLTITPADGDHGDVFTSMINGEEVFGINVDFSNLTLFESNGKSTSKLVRGSSKSDGGGRSMGKMKDISVDNSGMIYGVYSNGETKLLGQVVVAEFTNPMALEALGDGIYKTTQNSGEFDGIGTTVNENGGKMTQGVLEMSNVDLSAEFTEMITTQRGFQANSRIITTSDSMLEELVNLKR